MAYDSKCNCYVKRSYLGEGILGLRIGRPYSHLNGEIPEIYISLIVNEEDIPIIKLHEVIHEEDEYLTREKVRCLSIDLYGRYNQVLPKYL